MQYGQTILCGKGRLGQLIAAALHEQNIAHAFARIDARRGLMQDNDIVTGNIDTLIICLVPKHSTEKSGWTGLLDALLAQVKSKQLTINRVLFISSTSVYESIGHGFVDAHTCVTGTSARSQGLLDAETVIPQLSANTSIFRLTGLVGPGYTKYDPLTYSHDKPRQAVDTRAVALQVARWCAGQQAGHRIEVLTDGFVYWQGRKLDSTKNVEEIKQLSKSYRLLEPSIFCR